MFDKYFEVFLADTNEAKQIHFNIRFKVYCEEMGFENKEKFPTEQETDHWDNNATHFLVRLRHTQEWIGAVRLVKHIGKSLPLETHCAVTEPTSKINSVELSRLCLVKEIRKPFFDNPYGISENRPEQAESTDNNVNLFFSHNNVKQSIIWGLFRAASLYSAENNIKKWYFLTTKALARIITRKGFQMISAGKPCEHRGKRFPYKMDVNDILSSDFWNDYNNGYRLYSELEAPSYTKTATA